MKKTRLKTQAESMMKRQILKDALFQMSVYKRFDGNLLSNIMSNPSRILKGPSIQELVRRKKSRKLSTFPKLFVSCDQYNSIKSDDPNLNDASFQSDYISKELDNTMPNITQKGNSNQSYSNELLKHTNSFDTHSKTYVLYNDKANFH